MLGDLIVKKMRGEELNLEEFELAVSHMLKDGDTPKVKQFLSGLDSFGMSFKEVCFLAKAIKESGEQINEEVDFEKHSTGGVGDATSLVLVPLLASLGYKVIKVTNRSIRFTNGGRDRFLSIPNFNCELSKSEIHNALKTTNACVLSNCGDICPADRVLTELKMLYGLENNLNLLAAGLVGKKLVSNAKVVLMDVKYGRSALIENLKDAKKLANLIKRMFKFFNVKCVVFITNTQQMIGEAVGNAVEVLDAVEVLQGKKSLLRDVSVEFATEMIIKLDKNLNRKDVVDMLNSSLDSGVAFQKFLEIVKIQGGDEKSVLGKHLLVPAKTSNFISNADGYVGGINVLLLGELIRRLCADSHDNNIGAVLKVKIGDFISKGDVIVTLHYKNKQELEKYKEAISGCVRITKQKIAPAKVVKKVMR